MRNTIAIIVVAYNRVDSLRRLLSSLSEAYYDSSQNVPLIISIDKSETDIVELFSDDYIWSHGDKIVDKHATNLGLRNHMMSLGKWFDKYDALIILEDDIVVAKDFYNYAQQTVCKYHSDQRVAGISLYSFKLNYLNNLPFEPIYDGNDVYFMNCAMSWGEVWMREQWQAFYNWYLTHQEFPILPHLPLRLCMMGNKSWLKYHTRYCIETDKYFVFPYHSLSTNYSDVGTHNNGAYYSQYQVPLNTRTGGKYILPDFNNSQIKYDGYFENRCIADALNISTYDLCVDLNGVRKDIQNKRYWLTTQIRNYKIVSCFSDELRPLEQNVFLKQQGKNCAIFLYDTHHEEKNCHRTNVYLYRYYLGDIVAFIRKYGELQLIKDYCNHILRKFQKG